MTSPAPSATRLRTATLRRNAETAFRIEPDAEARAAIAEVVGAQALRKLRLVGQLVPESGGGFRLEAELGATAVQGCVVTLEPVTTRIDTRVERRFVPAESLPDPEAGSETEMPEDDTIEPMGDVIDLEAVMTEALSLALPSYPRKDDVEAVEAQFAADGVTPMTDDDVKPFAGLAALREKMQESGGDD
ncbi:YceD family protein [Pseudoponticoccus marisrubri]|uniref:50S ribosomal protein L34 n=1 Tax=Pseudoponticoccus marisrubri TaxID=1685382 RepID=A0A0W7WMF9_9RHOB|nr:DUF177 domain-containing protein [Pseudoponticoccus marisrubri]KUF11776.1 hypothetical protein AVJ23_04100 [Pseudoponticoccus marisrubri]